MKRPRSIQFSSLLPEFGLLYFLSLRMSEALVAIPPVFPRRCPFIDPFLPPSFLPSRGPHYCFPLRKVPRCLVWQTILRRRLQSLGLHGPMAGRDGGWGGALSFMQQQQQQQYCIWGNESPCCHCQREGSTCLVRREDGIKHSYKG